MPRVLKGLPVYPSFLHLVFPLFFVVRKNAVLLKLVIDGIDIQMDFIEIFYL